MYAYICKVAIHAYVYVLSIFAKNDNPFLTPQPIQLFRTPPSHAKLLGQTCAVEHALGAAGDVGATVDPQHHGTWPGCY